MRGPDGSLKNMVHCSPGIPWKRRCGSITNSTSAALNLSASCWNWGWLMARPKCGTGTGSPSDSVSERVSDGWGVQR